MVEPEILTEALADSAPVRERLAAANGIEIAYDELGDPDGEPLLLVMGLGMQLIHWDPRLCALLGERGFRVIRFDNRDAGHSTKIRGAPVPGVPDILLRRGRRAAYTLEDMADDAVGLLDHLGIGAAHMVGASLGGMIAQTLAISHPDRVLSLASVMSTTGNPFVGRPRPATVRVLLRRMPADRDRYIDEFVRLARVIGSPAYPTDEATLRQVASASYDRCYYPAGTGRQLLAMFASGDRTPALRRLRVPTVVIHGREDPLVGLSGGKATARAIPGSRLVVIPGMGHSLPPQVWPRIVEAVAENAARRSTAGAPR